MAWPGLQINTCHNTEKQTQGCSRPLQIVRNRLYPNVTLEYTVI